jgi:hypothetical protein
MIAYGRGIDDDLDGEKGEIEEELGGEEYDGDRDVEDAEVEGQRGEKPGEVDEEAVADPAHEDEEVENEPDSDEDGTGEGEGGEDLRVVIGGKRKRGKSMVVDEKPGGRLDSYQSLQIHRATQTTYKETLRVLPATALNKEWAVILILYFYTKAAYVTLLTKSKFSLPALTAPF